MLTVTQGGRLLAVVPFDYDMSSTGGPKGTSWSAWIIPSFESEPIKIKVKDERAREELIEAGFGAEVWLTVRVESTVKEIKRNGSVVASSPVQQLHLEAVDSIVPAESSLSSVA